MSENSSPPTEQVFVLTKADEFLENEGEPTTIIIARAGSNENEQRLKAWKEVAQVYGPNWQVTPMALRRVEVFLTLKGCNLDDWDDKPLFQFPLDEELFYKSWSKLPPLVADEIYEKVLSMNPLWFPDEHSSFLRSLPEDTNVEHLRTVICPNCDHHQKIDDSPENENLEIYDGDLEDEEEDGLWFVVICDSCGQPYRMLSDR